MTIIRPCKDYIIFLPILALIYYGLPVGGINLVQLNSANGLVVDEVYVLQNGKCTNFADDSGKQTIRYFRIVSDGQELVCKL